MSNVELETPQALDSELSTVPEAPSDAELLREAPVVASSAVEPSTVSESHAQELTVQTKVEGLKAILKTIHFAMVTTRASNGLLHSRVMSPSLSHFDNQLSVLFISNNSTHKFREIENDAHVNLGFINEKTTCWASFAGVARVSYDKELIKQHWNANVAHNFPNLHDGVHNGDEHDPRVAIIEVIPEEIHYWIAPNTHTGISKAISVVSSVVTGKSHPDHGELRTITKEEIQTCHESHFTERV